MKKRTAKKVRNTTETQITVKLNIDGTGKTKIDTGIGLLDHMLQLFAFHGLFDLEIIARGDSKKVDIHHTNEDIGKVLGLAFKEALSDTKGIKRFGFMQVPMEDVLATVALDISGRNFFNISITKGNAPNSSNGYSMAHAVHFLEALTNNLGMNLHVSVCPLNYDLHTTLEPIFKALGLALDQATQIDTRRKGVPSTKGIID